MTLTLRSMTSARIWDDFILRYAPSALFQSWLWGEVVAKMGQKFWRFGLYEDQKLTGLFAVLKVTARRGTFLHVRHGPVFLRPEKRYWKEFLEFMKDLARKENAWFIRISPLIDDSNENRLFLQSFGMMPSAIHAMDAELSWVLDIDKPKEELLAGMRKTTRYEIRQAEKLGIEVTSSTNVKDVPAFLRLYEETSSRHRFVPHSGIAEEFEVFVKQDKAILLLGKYNQQVLAGAVILFWGKQAVYHHSASLTSKIPASYFVQWQAILEAQKRAMLVYNFWGIAPEDKLNHPWRGLTLFKKGFGGREIKYIHAHDLPVTPLYFIPRIIETIRRIRKGY